MLKELYLKSIKLAGHKNSKIFLGPQYKKVFQEFVPETTLQVAKLLKQWEKTGILKNMLKINA